MVEDERTKFGIEGLDKALNGGLPKGTLVLISGGAGTGKSTLAMQFLVNGALKFGEKGLYISTEQTVDELRRQAKCFGWDLAALEQKGLLKIKFLDFVKGENALTTIYDSYSTFMPTRMVIDSLSSLTDSILISGLSEEAAFSFVQVAESVAPIPRAERFVAKSVIYQLIAKLRLFGATTLLISELGEKSDALSADNVSEFIADGVITLHHTTVRDREMQCIWVRKMRYTDHKKESLTYKIESGKGFVVYVE